MPSSDTGRPPSSTLGRWVRRLGGGTDALSALNPRDRAIYTNSGLLQLMSFALSVVAMASALTIVLPEAPWPVVVLPAAGWGLITASLDRMLVITSPGRGRRGLLHAAPALTLAMLLGITVVEPLVLRIFRPAIEARLGQDRPGLLDQLVALDGLARESPAVNAATWTLRLLFMLLFCMPLLARLLRRRTVQDDVFEYLVGASRTTRARSHLRLVERMPSAERAG